MSESAKNVDSMAIRVPNWVGDAIMATPALRSMRKGFPSSHICLVGKAPILKIFEGLPYYDESIPVTGRGLKQILPLAGVSRASSIYVCGPEMELLGVIRVHDVIDLAQMGDLGPSIVAADLMVPATAVAPESPLASVFDAYEATHLEELPVVDT